MAFTDYLRQPVTIVHVVESTTAVDPYNNPVKTEPDSITVNGFLEPVTETEQLVEAETTRTTWRLFLPPGTEISSSDLVTVDGQQLEVTKVLPFFNPRSGADHHIECELVEVVG